MKRKQKKSSRPLLRKVQPLKYDRTDFRSEATKAAMTVNSNDRATKSETPMREITFPIFAYVDRMKLKAQPGSTSRESAKIMFEILAKKKIPSRKANDAALKALDAAADHRLAESRFAQRQNAKEHETGRLDELIEIFKKLNAAISELPTAAKSMISVRTAEVTKDGKFDTETFIELVNCIAACLPKLSPQKSAADALVALHADGSSKHSLPVIMLWESIPPLIRTNVEQNLERRLRLRGIELLRLFPDLLDKFRPKKRMGAPPSIHFAFALKIERIWLELGLKSGRQYDGCNGRHLKSPFVRFCEAALAAVGTEGAISNRQVGNLKKRRRTPPRTGPK
ncbi:hypothetical protein [Bradyrhizobium sp. AZCC 2289]|uniref:hypothetical protein n=1 Tax=Bradyrhizobium sp. AZCC 2289 TaxID=3117026 RepID=UPI002FF266A8